MPMYFKNAHIILIVYDMTSRQSFNQVNHYLEKIKIHTDNAKIILVGNKSDLEEHREISHQEGQTFANEHELIFIECSASQNINIDALFNLVIKELEHIKPVSFNTINLEKDPPSKDLTCCY
jgi:small GTP-binding protein